MFGDNYLAHYGVQGMKWGVRRTAVQLGRSIKSGFTAMKRRSETASEKTKKTKKSEKSEKVTAKRLSEMTTAELTARLNRLDLEKRYLQYTTQPEKSSRAKKVVADMLEQGAKALAAKAFQKMTDKILGDKQGDSVTSYRVSDLSKVGDKKMKAMSERVEQERKVTSYIRELASLSPATSASKAEKGASIVDKLLDGSPGQLSIFDFWPGNPETN